MEANHAGSTGFSIRFHLNRSFIYSIIGGLQIGVVVTGLLVVSILGSAMTHRLKSVSGYWNIGGLSFYAFLFLIAFWCFMTSLIIVLTSVLNEHSATHLPETMFYICFHLIAAVFYLIGTLALLIEAAKYSIVYYDAKSDIKSEIFAGGSIGGVVTGLYIVITAFAITKHIRSRS